MTNQAAGSSSIHLLGHRLSGPEEALTLFRHLGTDAHSRIFREAIDYGQTRVLLDQQHWQLIRQPDHSFHLTDQHHHQFV